VSTRRMPGEHGRPATRADEDARLLQMIRAKLAEGRLPTIPPQSVFGGRSSGETCAVCDERIVVAAEIEAEGTDGLRRYYHPRCYWLLSQHRFSAPPSIALRPPRTP
jgi:hypothetical protein